MPRLDSVQGELSDRTLVFSDLGFGIWGLGFGIPPFPARLSRHLHQPACGHRFGGPFPPYARGFGGRDSHIPPDGIGSGGFSCSNAGFGSVTFWTTTVRASAALPCGRRDDKTPSSRHGARPATRSTSTKRPRCRQRDAARPASSRRISLKARTGLRTVRTFSHQRSLRRSLTTLPKQPSRCSRKPRVRASLPLPPHPISQRKPSRSRKRARTAMNGRCIGR